jgi:hypothetical protein
LSKVDKKVRGKGKDRSKEKDNKDKKKETRTRNHCGMKGHIEVKILCECLRNSKARKQKRLEWRWKKIIY